MFDRAAYMREWRKRHPKYVEKDRELARERMQKLYDDPEWRSRKVKKQFVYNGTAAGLLVGVRQGAKKRKGYAPEN